MAAGRAVVQRLGWLLLLLVANECIVGRAGLGLNRDWDGWNGTDERVVAGLLGCMCECARGIEPSVTERA